MAHKLGIFWTVLPNSVEYLPPPPPPPTPTDGPGGLTPVGEGGGELPPPVVIPVGTRKLRFSATIAFRLVNGDGSGQAMSLSEFGPLLDWPATLNAITWGVNLESSDVFSFEPTRLPGASHDVWAALFPPGTRVRSEDPKQYEARDTRVIRSFPRREMKQFVRGLHAGSEYESASNPRTVVRAPIPATVLQQRLRAITTARENRASLAGQIEALLHPQPATPTTWAVTRQARQALGNTNVQFASDFVQLNSYYRRLAEAATEPLPAARPVLKTYDFHQLAAMSLMQPVVARALGLIVDFELDVPDYVGGNGEMWLTADYPTEGVDRADAFYRTAFHLDNELFEIPSEDAQYDANGRYLRLGSGAYDIEDGLDVDSAALKADGAEETFSAALQADDLPALKTTGIGINRVENAVKLADVRKRDRMRFNAAFGKNSAVKETSLSADDLTPNPSFVNHAEDLIRGFRFDVYDVARGRWHSLHRRSGQYIVGRGSDAVVLELPVDGSDEGFMTIAPVRPRQASTTQAPPLDEYYLSESIMRWGGWSLSVPRVGAPIMNGDKVMDRDGDGKPDFERPRGTLGSVVANIATAHALPRLRFGSTYRFRARVVDTAGNSVPFDRNVAPADLGDAVSEEVTFRRYDPIESPTLIYRNPPVPGETIHEMVLRSDGVDDHSDGEVRRLVPPPATSQWIAECHGAFDSSIDGDDAAAVAQYNALLRDREGLSWSDGDFDKPIPGARPGEFYVPVVPHDDEITVPYLPDPAATGVLFQNLPGVTPDDDFYEGTGLTERVPFTSEWPNIQPLEIKMVKGDAAAGPGAYIAPTSGGRQMLINLHKGDIHTLGLSSVPSNFADVFGLLQWATDESAVQNPGIPRDQIEDGIKRGVVDGFHRSISPIQVVKLVHAVRRPLSPPVFQVRGVPGPNGWSVVRHLGETQAFPGGEIGYSPRSTGRLDVRAVWNDLHDAGPGGPNPTIPIPRAAQVFSLELNRNKVREGLFPDAAGEPVSTGEAVQEFGDTHHYRTTYFPKATTAFLKYFRESATVPFGPGQAVTQTFSTKPVSKAPIHVVGKNTKTHYAEGTSYFLDRATRTVTKIANVNPEIKEPVTVSFIPGVIDWEGEGKVIDVPSTVRPNPPLVHSIVPMFRWNRAFKPAGLFPKRIQSTRSGGGLRVWLDRPWWSSGEGEMLGVVVQPLATPLNDDSPFYSQAGTDAATDSRNTNRLLNSNDFEGNNEVAHASLAETGKLVDVVPYTVQFDSVRDQWFADITVNPSVTGAVGYFPFVKLSLVRYQPYSMKLGEFAPGTSIEQTVALSSVVMTDFIQVAPQRDVEVSKPNATTLHVSVTGESYRAMQKESNPFNYPSGRGPSRMVATLQRRNTKITDPVLTWETVYRGLGGLGGPITTELQNGQTSSTGYSWSGDLAVPNATAAERAYEYRVLVEEFELHYADTDGNGPGPPSNPGQPGGNGPSKQRVPSGLRCVFQDMITLEGL